MVGNDRVRADSGAQVGRIACVERFGFVELRVALRRCICLDAADPFDPGSPAAQRVCRNGSDARN